MITYNSKNIIVGYIKQILKSYNLPSIKILKDNENCQICKGTTYLYQNNLLKAVVDKDYLDGFTYDSNEFIINDIFKENTPFLNLTHNFEIKNNYYDSYTHEILGDFLRFKKDYYNFDLMSMYNCFSGQTANNLRIKVGDYVFNTEDKSSKIYVVPVRLWKTYKIIYDCDTKIETVVGLYRDNKQITEVYDGDVNVLEKLYTDTYKKYSGIRFNSPVIYDKLASLKTDKLIINKESELTLFVKVPVSNMSSFAVIECDNDEISTNVQSHMYFDTDSNYSKYTNIITNYADENSINNFNYFYSQNQLSAINDKKNHPFADRLVEYLANNVITEFDEIGLNLRRVEDNLIDKNLIETYTPFLEWTNRLRVILYQAACDKNLLSTKYNILGYVDKDIEDKVVGEYDYSRYSEWES